MRSCGLKTKQKISPPAKPGQFVMFRRFGTKHILIHFEELELILKYFFEILDVCNGNIQNRNHFNYDNDPAWNSNIDFCTGNLQIFKQYSKASLKFENISNFYRYLTKPNLQRSPPHIWQVINGNQSRLIQQVDYRVAFLQYKGARKKNSGKEYCDQIQL